jgi:hypothetical protein
MANHTVPRVKNMEWRLWADENGQSSLETITAFILMDIREELRTLNHTLACPNFQDIPHKLDNINRKLAKPRKKKTP